MSYIRLATAITWLSAAGAFGQTNVFTYQGQLRNGGVLVSNGIVPMSFQLMGSLSGTDNVGAPIPVNAEVTNGLFAVRLDFSAVANAFNGQQRWLQITVNGAPLSPRQELTPGPYSTYAYTATLAQTVASGSITANSLQPNLFTNGTPYSVWSLAGNSGVNAASQFLGTTDAQALNLRANNKRVMAFTEGANTGNTLRAVNVVGGSEVNSIAPGVVGGTIAGGGLRGLSGPDGPNKIDGDFGSIGGGSGNYIDVFRYAAIGGGSGNVVQGNYSVIAGGIGNNVQSDDSQIGGGLGNYVFGQYATVAGGHLNQATSYAGSVAGGDANTVNGAYGFVGGGWQNTVSGYFSAVGGGAGNSVGGYYSAIGGGNGNTASLDYAVIAGGRTNKASSRYTTVGGGQDNSATESWATIGGGNENVASGQNATIAGGVQNYAGADWATVGGGEQNWATGFNSVVGGGYLNQATATYSMIPGGYYCYASGIAGLAAGNRAVAGYNGCFVWSDFSADQDFSATAANQFCIRAQGGIVVESFGNVSIYTGVGTTDAGRYVQLLNSPKAPSASGLKAGGVLVSDSYAYANPGKNDLVVKGTLGVGYPSPAPYTMAVNGNVYALNGYLSSDARYKTNISTLTNALDCILNLRGVSFDWRKNEFKEVNFSSGRQVGLIAQEVETVLPELVKTDRNGHRALAYSSVIPILVEGMKEQQAQIVAQRKRIEELEDEKAGRMNDLQAQIDELKKALVGKRP
jgi:hypothetical protein